MTYEILGKVGDSSPMYMAAWAAAAFAVVAFMIYAR